VWGASYTMGFGANRFGAVDTKLMVVTLLILNRFSNFVHCQILLQICSKVFLKDPKVVWQRMLLVVGF